MKFENRGACFSLVSCMIVSSALLIRVSSDGSSELIICHLILLSINLFLLQSRNKLPWVGGGGGRMANGEN